MSNPRDSSKQSTPPQSPPLSPTPPHTTVEVPPHAPPSTQQAPAPSSLLAGVDAAAEGEKVTAAPAPAEGGSEAIVAARMTPPRKRYREGDSGAGSSIDMAQGQGQFKCSVCSRVFSKEKGLFGHMRSHRDRSWRGAYPPPVFSREEIDEDMAKVMEALSGRAEEEAAAAAAAEAAAAVAAPPRSERPEIPDINEPAVEEEPEEPPSTPPRRQRTDGKEINLNKPPSPES